MSVGEEFYDACVALGVECKSVWLTDLVIPVTDETTALVEEYQYKNMVRKFKEGKAYFYEVPSAYMPFWRSCKKFNFETGKYYDKPKTK